MRGHVTARSRSLVAGVFVAAAIAASPAHAAEKPPSAADQYVEDVPTAEGSRPAAAGEAVERPVAPQVDSAIREQGGTESAVLRRVVSSSRYGAPRKEPPRTALPGQWGGRDGRVGIGSFVSTAGLGGESRLGVLLVVLAAMTAAAPIAARHRDR
jgi:hypothetical protein